MKKVLAIIIVLLSFGVIAFGAYYVATHDFSVSRNNDNKDNVELNEGIPNVDKDNKVTLVDIKEVEESFIQTYDIIINGTEKTLQVEFIYRDNESLKQESLTGDYSGVTLYAYYEDYENDNRGFDKNVINSTFNEDNFGFIKGVNGDSYLLIHTNIYDDGSQEEDKLFILNEDLEFISNDLIDYAGSSDTKGMSIMSTYTTYFLEDEKYPWYSDSFKACSTPTNCYINVKIDNNKIYYLVPVLKEVNEEAEVADYGELEERVYTISNDELSYEVIKRYKITKVEGITEEM